VEDTSRYIIAILQGEDQSGKTRFAFTAPEPILCMTFDPGNIQRGVAREFAGKKDIQLAAFELPKGLIASSALAAKAKEEQSRWEEIYTEAIIGSYFKTVILDREDETWELFRYDEFDGKQSAKPHHFTPLNSHYKALLKLAEKYKKNLLLIDCVKDEWKNDKPTGKMRREGFKHLGMLSQLTLENRRKGTSFEIEVIACRDDATKNGSVLTPVTISTVMEEMGYPYPQDSNGAYVYFDISFENVMTYLIGGTVDEWK
jgi:hypothetical protein